MAKITWSLEALEDVSEIGLFIERSSSHFAEVIVNRLYSSVDRLIEFPLSGREVPELPDACYEKSLLQAIELFMIFTTIL